MCGEVKSKEKDKTASTPLVTVSDLQKLKLFQAIIIRLRMYPFKTKLEPDFKMDWGMKREEVAYPTREIKKIELFDLKKFVTEEKRKQMMSNLENNNSGQTPFSSNFGNPFTSGGMPNPFSSGMNNPFAGKDLSSSSSPFSNDTMFNRPMSNLSDLDIDQMMKDIDRRLKELDEEEARERAMLEQANKETNNDPKIQTEPVSSPMENKEFNRVEENEMESIDELPKVNEVENKAVPNKEEQNQNKPKINVDADSIIVNDNVITDDEFFDDFFGD